MEIPETGAVFTLGKSYLSENHQSYFFIKNDPIKKLIAGRNQSAVICESGRLFVWGENQFGQLATGTNEIVTKPSCVKVIKNLGYKVRNIAFGQSFSVILTENSRIYFNGKSIFTLNESYGNKLWHLGNGEYITRQNFEITDFQKYCLDSDGNFDDLVDVVAGDNFFVVLTNTGKLYCYGLLDSSNIKSQKKLLRPILISENIAVRVVKCGTSFIVFVNDRNETFIIGQFNHINYKKLTKLNTSALVNDSIYSLYVSRDDYIFLISSSGYVYKSTNETDIHFERIILFNDSDVVRKFCSGNDFVCVLTDKNKLVTTFTEKSSAKRNNWIVPRELKKFHNLHILDIATGIEHILLFAVSKTRIYTSVDVSSSDPNENTIQSNQSPERKINEPSIDIPPKHTKIDKENDKETVNEIPIIPIKIPFLSDTEKPSETNQNNIDDKLAEKVVSEALLENVEKRKLNNNNNEDEQILEENLVQPFQKEVNKMDKAISNIGSELMSDVKDVVDTGKAQINTMKENVTQNIHDAQKNVIAKIGDEKKEIENKTDKVIGDIMTETNEVKNFLKQKLDKTISFGNSATEAIDKKLDENIDGGVKQIDKTKEFLRENQNEIDKLLRTDKIRDELEKDEKIEVIINNNNNNNNVKMEDKVKFIDNGRDIADSNDIIESMNQEIKEMHLDDPDDDNFMEMKKNVPEKLEKIETIVNDSPNNPMQTINTMEKMKRDIKQSNDPNYKIIPLKYDLEDVDMDGDVTERSTASIKSSSSQVKSQFDDADTKIDINHDEMETMKKSNSGGHLKRFIDNIRNNCKSTDTVVEPIESSENVVKSRSVDDIVNDDNKTSKVCVIL